MVSDLCTSTGNSCLNTAYLINSSTPAKWQWSQVVKIGCGQVTELFKNRPEKQWPLYRGGSVIDVVTLADFTPIGNKRMV